MFTGALSTFKGWVELEKLTSLLGKGSIRQEEIDFQRIKLLDL